nr:DUF3077 domain-containing protein [Pseudomonas fulva]
MTGVRCTTVSRACTTESWQRSEQGKGRWEGQLHRPDPPQGSCLVYQKLSRSPEARQSHARSAACTFTGEVSFTTQTIGAGTSAKARAAIFHRLFQVVPDHGLDDVLEQSSRLMGCVYKLTLEATLQQDDTLLLAACYLSSMVKALAEDMALARMLTPGKERQR